MSNRRIPVSEFFTVFPVISVGVVMLGFPSMCIAVPTESTVTPLTVRPSVSTDLIPI